MRTLAMIALLAALGACTPLTANAPLFTPADSAGPPPFMEGTWVALNDKCTRATAMRHGGPPAACEPFQIHHLADGAWELSGNDTEHGPPHRVSFRFVVAPAVARTAPDAYAALYVAEYLGEGSENQTPEQANAPHYAAIAPIGEMPAHELFLDASIECDTILREGPIDGVAVKHNDQGGLSTCIAVDQGAVREATRRAIIEGIANIDRNRLVFVGPDAARP